jgi:hypothetical protein
MVSINSTQNTHNTQNDEQKPRNVIESIFWFDLLKSNMFPTRSAVQCQFRYFELTTAQIGRKGTKLCM